MSGRHRAPDAEQPRLSQDDIEEQRIREEYHGFDRLGAIMAVGFLLDQLDAARDSARHAEPAAPPAPGATLPPFTPRPGDPFPMVA